MNEINLLKLYNFYININAITQIECPMIDGRSYDHHVLIYTGDPKPRVIPRYAYNIWVEQNDLPLPSFINKNVG